MQKSTLISSAFAALLIASPGLALAQSNNSGNVGNGHGSAAHGGAVYANIGQGGYTGTATPIRGNNGHNGNNNNGNGHGNRNGGNTADMRPSQRNPLLSDNGDVRASKMIGTNVYSTGNHQIGTVKDVLVGRNGVWAVVSANNHKVAVPFRDFEFGNSNVQGNDKLVLPHMTQAQLNKRPAFHYHENNYASNNGGFVRDNGHGGNLADSNNNGNGGPFANNGRNGNGGGFFGNNHNNNNGNR